MLACREQREAAARAEAEAERDLVTQPNGIAKLGAKFWASTGQEGLDAFGQPRSEVSKEIFTADDVVEEAPRVAWAEGEGGGEEAPAAQPTATVPSVSLAEVEVEVEEEGHGGAEDDDLHDLPPLTDAVAQE